MAETYTYDGSPLGSIQGGSVTLTERANMGNAGSGSVVVQDVAGTIEIVGEKHFVVAQSSCSVPWNFLGHTISRTYARGQDTAEKVEASRDITVSLVDLNARLGFRVLREAHDADRPIETVGARLTWLLATPELASVNIADHGYVDYPTKKIDANNYASQHPGDVLADCAERMSWNFFVYWDVAANAAGLWFKDSNTSTDWTSSLRISNVIADIDESTTFPPSPGTVLTRDPEHTVSGVLLPYGNNQAVYRTRPATATAYAPRDGVAPNSNVKTAARAREIADSYLFQHRDEEDTITTTLLLPADKVNLVRAGQRMEAKFSHYGPEGYDDFTWFRVTERTLRPHTKGAKLYDVDLSLSPQEAGIAASACPYETTPAGDYYPLGDQPPTGPSEWYDANPSDGFTYYLRPGIFYPTVPTPGAQSAWHFIAHVGAGGAGSIDYAGDCVQNSLQFMPIGPGTLTVQTEIYGGSVRPMGGSWGEGPDAYANSIGTFSSGDEVEFVVTGECVNLIRLYDGPGSPCGGKWGWSVAHWEPA